MHYIIAVVGMLIVAEGVLFAIRPDVLDKLINFSLIGKRIYAGGVLRAILAALFLILSSKCAHPWIIILFGITFMIGAIIIFAYDIEKFKSILKYWLSQKEYIKRIVGGIAFMLGLIIIYGSMIK